ncbi:uncharacterized protein EDB91DRAFT_1177988 [Suillus paluster]|uniref:uncharacterized protein n=1 Tax=Suillus paluster TaxID=48578 RepID=UPI001B8754DB|nr:uncharacterized protein EDB91DRAFT_1177988 [Suillus paluster]KAG1720504.1 hypothetical protein EDB91DRAFT_1177988 [Suillus paluster]
MPACYYGFSSFPSTNTIMLISRSIIFAVLSFLAGANACVQCPATLQVDDRTSHLYEAFPLVKNQSRFCVYNDDKLNGDDSSVACEYDIENGQLVEGYRSCPYKATVKNSC